MSLPHAILTALAEKASSGRELTRRFDRSIGYFWSATHQQIYRELARLEAAGLIRQLPADRPRRGRPRDYGLLPAGYAELAGWLARADDPRPIRDPLMLRLRAAAVVGPEAAAGLLPELERHLQLHRDQRAEYRRIEQRDFTDPTDRDPTDGHPADADAADAVSVDEQAAAALQHLVLQAGIELESLWIGWLTRAIARLRPN